MKTNVLKTLSLIFLLTIVACSKPSNVSSNISLSSINQKEESISNYESSNDVHVHTPGEIVIENKIDATCTKEGSYDEVIYCLECHEELSRTHKINNPTGHLHLDTREENRIEPTCTLEGSVDIVTYCKDDGVEISREHKVIDALGHDYSEWNIVKESTDNQDGLRIKTCSRCSNTIEETIPTTSPFTFTLNSDGVSYTLDGLNVVSGTYYPSSSAIFNGGYHNTSYTHGAATINVPETFNDLPVTTVDLNLVILESEPVPDIFVPKNTKIQFLSVRYDNSLRTAINEIFSMDKKSIQGADFNLYYLGNLEDWLINQPINKKTKFNNGDLFNIHLYLKDIQTSEFHFLEELIVPENTKTIPDYSFSHISIKSVTCNSHLESIGTQSFYQNQSLININFNNIKSIGNMAFYGCNALNSIVIPSSVESIDRYAFFGCLKLYEIHISSGASGYIDSVKSAVSLNAIKVIDENNGDSYLDETKVITKNNANNSEIFKYMDFTILKINDTYSLVSYNGSEEVLFLPEYIIYKDNQVHSYNIRRDFLPMGFSSGNKYKPQDIVNAYTNVFEMRQNYFSKNNIFFKIVFNNNNISIEKNAFMESYFISEVYFNGTYEKWCSLGNNLFPYSIAQMVKIKVSDSNYTEMPINH